METYHVQALIQDLSGEYMIARDRWTDIFDVPRGDSGIDELVHARSVRQSAERFYVSVRLVRRGPAGEDRVVQ